MYGLSDASYFQWAAYLLRVYAVSSELRYSLIFIFLSVSICFHILFQHKHELSTALFFPARWCFLFWRFLIKTPELRDVFGNFVWNSTHYLFLPFNTFSLPSILKAPNLYWYLCKFWYLPSFLTWALFLLKALRLFLTLFPPLILTAISLASTDVCWTKYFEQLSSYSELLDIVVGQSSSNLFFI